MEDSKRATVPKQGGSITDKVKDAIAKDVDEVEGDLKSIYEYVLRIFGFFTSLSKLCILLVLEPLIVVSNMISELEFDQILQYIGYMYLAVFVVIPLKIFAFFISMPYVITKKLCQTSIDFVNVYFSLWKMLFLKIQYNVMQLEQDVSKLEKDKQASRPAAKADLASKLKTNLNTLLYSIYTPQQVTLIEETISGKNVSPDSKWQQRRITANGK